MNFTSTHGDTFQFFGDVELAWPLGCTTCTPIPFDLTNYTATGYITRSSDSCQLVPMEVEIVNAVEGRIHAILSAEQAVTLDRRAYQYEVVITGTDLVFTAFKGTVTFA